MSKTINAIIADDEITARENLYDLLAVFCPDVKVVTTCSTIESALQAVQQNKIDVLFLDINFGKETGFDLINKLPADQNVLVVFVTAHDNFALDAFKNNVIDYLLKPIAKNELIRCVEKCKRLLKQNDTPNEIVNAINQLKKLENKKIIVTTREGSDIIPVQDILFLEANGSYTKIVLVDNKELISSKNLKHHYAEMEESGLIIRIHKSHAVNKNEITKIIKSPITKIILSNHMEFAVSDQYKDELYQALV